MCVSRPYKCAQVVWVGDPRDTCGLPGLMESGCPSRSAPGSSGAELPFLSRRFLSQGSACSTTWCWADVAARAVLSPLPCHPLHRDMPPRLYRDCYTSLGLLAPAREGALSPAESQFPASRAQLLRSGWRR